MEKQNKEFGKDYGLIHEAIVTLRKVAEENNTDLHEWFERVAHKVEFARSIILPEQMPQHKEADLVVDGIRYHRHPNGGGLVAETARVAETAYVGPFALVKDKAQVLDEARIEDRAVISEKAVIREKAQVSGSALVCDSALVYGSTRVCGSARVFGSALVYGSARVFEGYYEKGDFKK